MCIYLGATILQYVSEMTERFIHRCGISGGDGARGCDERFALPGSVLVEDENCKDVAEKKSGGDQGDAPEDIEAARAHPFERGRDTWPETRRTNAC